MIKKKFLLIILSILLVNVFSCLAADAFTVTTKNIHSNTYHQLVLTSDGGKVQTYIRCPISVSATEAKNSLIKNKGTIVYYVEGKEKTLNAKSQYNTIINADKAYANLTPQDKLDTRTENFSVMEKLAWNTVKSALGGNLVDDLGPIISLDLRDPQVSKVWTGAVKAEEGVAVAGYALLVLYFLMELAEQATKDSFTMEHFIRVFIKLIVGIYLMQNLMVIIEFGLNFGHELFDLIGSPGNNGTTEELEKYADQIDGGGFIVCIGITMTFLLQSMLMDFCSWICSVVCYARLIEIAVRAIFAPVGMADMFTEGTRSSGFRYLKKFIAVCLQGAVILGILLATSWIQTAVMSNSFEDITHLIIALTATGLILRSQSIANDIMGV